MSHEVITETTVGLLDGVAVAVGNVWERDYADADGTRRAGMTARLAWTDAGGTDHWEVAGAGSLLSLGTSHWRVVAVDKAPGTPGRVTLRRENPADA
ncbi:MAG: hypothetical protein RLZZ299_1950 [Pseudomonadota bacterium]|jgi:hypothetical protein